MGIEHMKMHENMVSDFNVLLLTNILALCC